MSLDSICYRLGLSDRNENALQYLKEKEKKIYSFDLSCYKELGEESDNEYHTISYYSNINYCRDDIGSNQKKLDRHHYIKVGKILI